MQWFCPVWLFSTSISREICSIIVSLKMGKQIVKILRIFFCFVCLQLWIHEKYQKHQKFVKKRRFCPLWLFSTLFSRKKPQNDILSGNSCFVLILCCRRRKKPLAVNTSQIVLLFLSIDSAQFPGLLFVNKLFSQRSDHWIWPKRRKFK